MQEYAAHWVHCHSSRITSGLCLPTPSSSSKIIPILIPYSHLMSCYSIHRSRSDHNNPKWIHSFPKALVFFSYEQLGYTGYHEVSWFKPKVLSVGPMRPKCPWCAGQMGHFSALTSNQDLTMGCCLTHSHVLVSLPETLTHQPSKWVEIQLVTLILSTPEGDI